MQRRGYPAPPLVGFGDLVPTGSLTSASCFRHPDGANKGKHSDLSSENPGIQRKRPHPDNGVTKPNGKPAMPTPRPIDRDKGEGHGPPNNWEPLRKLLRIK